MRLSQPPILDSLIDHFLGGILERLLHLVHGHAQVLCQGRAEGCALVRCRLLVRTCLCTCETGRDITLRQHDGAANRSGGDQYDDSRHKNLRFHVLNSPLLYEGRSDIQSSYFT